MERQADQRPMTMGERLAAKAGANEARKPKFKPYKGGAFAP